MDSEELRTTVLNLKKLSPGELPLSLFLEIARLAVLTAIEFVPLRQKENGVVEVLLIQREIDDPNWPGMLHTPGTILRACDQVGSFKNAFDRISQELSQPSNISEPVFVKNIFQHTTRGSVSALVFWVELNEEVESGHFYPSDSLPKSIVVSQLEFIQDAVEAFKNRKSLQT